MSDIVNTALLERAQDCMEHLTSHPSGIDRRIQQSINEGDLDTLNYLVAIAEGIMSQEDFEATDVV